jgi:hypothetical protein
LITEITPQQMKAIRENYTELIQVQEEVISGKTSSTAVSVVDKMNQNGKLVLKAIPAKGRSNGATFTLEMMLNNNEVYDFYKLKAMAQKLVLAEPSNSIEQFLTSFNTAEALRNILNEAQSAYHFAFQQFEVAFAVGETLQMDQLIAFVKKEVEAWNDLLDSLRKQHYSMNCYTAQDFYTLGSSLLQGKISVISHLLSLCTSSTEPNLMTWKKIYNVKHQETNQPKGLPYPLLSQAITEALWRLRAIATYLSGVCQTKLSEASRPAEELKVYVLPSDTSWVFGLLSIYGATCKRSPFSHEVLLCTSYTTKEDCNIFLNRLLLASKGSVFTITLPDNLPPAVASWLMDATRALKSSASLVLLIGSHQSPFGSLSEKGSSLCTILPKAQLEQLIELQLKEVATRLYFSPSGEGKSFYIRQQAKTMRRISLFPSTTIEHFIKDLLSSDITTIHFDITIPDKEEPFNTESTDSILFRLLILRVVKDAAGNLFHPMPSSRYFIEIGGTTSRSQPSQQLMPFCTLLSSTQVSDTNNVFMLEDVTKLTMILGKQVNDKEDLLNELFNGKALSNVNITCALKWIQSVGSVPTDVSKTQLKRFAQRWFGATTTNSQEIHPWSEMTKEPIIIRAKFTEGT